MSLLCFPWMKYIGTASGLLGLGLSTVKLWTVPLPEDAKALAANDLWPGSSAVFGIRLLCGTLIVLAILCPLLLRLLLRFVWIA
jgi:hypothetical protein